MAMTMLLLCKAIGRMEPRMDDFPFSKVVVMVLYGRTTLPRAPLGHFMDVRCQTEEISMVMDTVTLSSQIQVMRILRLVDLRSRYSTVRRMACLFHRTRAFNGFKQVRCLELWSKSWMTLMVTEWMSSSFKNFHQQVHHSTVEQSIFSWEILPRISLKLRIGQVRVQTINASVGRLHRLETSMTMATPTRSLAQV